MYREKPHKIKNKLTSAGLPNPRLRNARAQEALMFRKDLVGEFKTWTRKEIAREYTDERIASLLEKGNINLMSMRAPGLAPYMFDDQAR